MTNAYRLAAMNSSRSNWGAGAFTLVELLCVIAIISILAALLLPALNQSQSRVKRIECESQLHQLGIAFQTFSHDHNDQFPMAVPMAEGGSLEFVQNGYALDQEFYFSFRQFQVLSNELSAPIVLVCPTDTRPHATDFGVLQNSNLSYFVGVKAAYAKSDSILAGDRNLTANSMPNPSILHIEPDNPLRWTWELHQSKGNVLFAGGQVEEWNNAGLASGTANQQMGADLFIPTVLPGPNAPAPVIVGSQNYSSPGPGAVPPPPPNPTAPVATPTPAPANPANNFPRSSGHFNPNPVSPTPGPGGPGSTTTRTNRPAFLSTNLSNGGTVVSNETDTATLTFDQRVVRAMRRIIFGTYLLVLLIFLALLAFKAWQRAERKREQQKGLD